MVEAIGKSGGLPQGEPVENKMMQAVLDKHHETLGKISSDEGEKRTG